MTLKEKYKILFAQRRALLATNYYNYETLHAVILAAKSAKASLILQLTKSSIQYMGLKQAVSMARIESSIHGVETWVHLDHGDSYELAAECIDAGFDSVMIDASEKPLEENIRITKKVADYAHSCNVCVEAELGYVAKLGQSSTQTGLTEPREAKLFVEQTGVDALAVAIGTAHGFYKAQPKLDFDRLGQIHGLLSIPLVLHGASGIESAALRQAIGRGVCKINLATEIKNVFMKKIKHDLQTSSEIDLRIVFPPAIDRVVELVTQKIIDIS